MDIFMSMGAVALVSLLAAVSPGPDFFIVLRNSLVYSRKSGFLTAFGVAAALIVHLTYTLVGIGVLIAESPTIYFVLKVVGALYLLYIGCRGIYASFKEGVYEEASYAKSSCPLSGSAAFVQGFLTNLLNPKCALFFISLFSQFISLDTPVMIKLAYAFINWSIALAWFLFLAYLVTAKQVHGRLVYFRAYIDRVMGGALVVLGVRLLLV